ncbi:hypothetical protein, partial [Amycolatopsis lurida]|uniref:hypothetical protein n=1 Tax=Amycolatopsis lurida TaxID=31959 RepID=UPI0036501C46
QELFSCSLPRNEKARAASSGPGFSLGSAQCPLPKPWSPTPNRKSGDVSHLIKHEASGNRDGQSPFDRIKQTRPDGAEFWSARALQGLMGYARWQNLSPAIARAQQSASNTGMDVTREFLQVEMGTGSRNPSDVKVDFELSRQAAYLVAMNGDPNKPEVAAAQAYFATRTLQAEEAEQEHDELPAWARSQIDTIRRVGKIEVEQIRQRERLDKVEHRLDGIEGNHGWYTALAYAKNMGLNTSMGATQTLGKVASQICRRRGIQPEKRTDARFGHVNLYPEDVLAEAARSMSAPA